MDAVTGCMKKVWGCFNYKDNDQASAFLKLSTSRGAATVYSALYATIALTFLAKLVEDCDGNILGGSIKSSSIISSTIVIEGVLTGISSPLSGVIADGTSYRKLIYSIFHAGWIAMVLLQAFIVTTGNPTDSTVVMFMIALILVSVFLELSITMINAYIPEVTKDEHDVHDLNARTFAYLNGSQMILALVVAGAGIFLFPADTEVSKDKQAFTLAQIGAGFVAIVALYLTIPAIGKLKGRPKAKEQIGKCSSVTGLINNVRDSFTLYPQVGTFLISYMFLFAGVNNVVGLASLYLVEGAGIPPGEVALASAALLFCAIPGALLVAPLLKKMPIKIAYQAQNLYWLLLLAVSPFAMVGDFETEARVGNNESEYEPFNPNNCSLEQQLEKKVVQPKEGAFFLVLVFAILYGIGIGLAFPIAQSIMVMIIPGGKEAGYFGLKTVAAKLLAWAPALSFTVVNESLENRIDLAFFTIAPFFLMAFLTGLLLDFDKAADDIKDTLHLRHKEQIGARELMKEDGIIAVQVEQTVKADDHSI